MTPSIHLVSIAPPFREGFANMKRPPSGILYVGGFLKENGFPVVIHHILEKEIDKTVDRILTGAKPLFVGFSLMTGKQVSLSGQMSEKIKKQSPDITIVWGGIHPSLLPEECLVFPFVDYVIIGEGEKPSLGLARVLAGYDGSVANLKGVGYRENSLGKINASQSFEKCLDSYRQDWSLVEVENYVRVSFEGNRGFSFITSRGCPHTCGFCYNQKFNERRWRSHSIEFVVNEILKIREQTGINAVSFDDDNFFTDRKRGVEIIRRLEKEGIECRWVDLRVDYVTEELMSQLSDIGVKSIFMGWESGSENTLQKIAKEFSPDLILEKTRILAKFNKITVDASAIVGFPWETAEDMEKTVQLAIRMFEENPFRMNFNIGLYIPYPGAPVTEEAERRGFEFPADCEGWSNFDILSGEMELPWLDARTIKKYHVVDKYFKLLYIFPFLKFPIKQAAYSAAILAYFRLKIGVFFIPWEIWMTDWFKRRKFSQLEES